MTKRIAVLNTDAVLNKHALKEGWSLLTISDCQDADTCVILDKKGIVYFIVGSLVAEYPIKVVAINASKAGYKVIVLQDQIDDEMKKVGVVFSTTEKVIKLGPEEVWATTR